jgi:tight adherence protein C
MDSPVLQVLISMLLFGSIVLLIWSLFRFPVPSEPPLHRRFALAVGQGQRQTLFENPTLAPIMNLALSLAKRFSFGAVRDLVRRDLNAAGNRNGYSIDEYVAICLFTGVGLSLACALLVWLVLSDIEPFTPVLMAGIGFGVPLWTLHEAGRRRVTRISKRLPYALDLIALMMEAGSTFTEAVETIVRDDPDDDFNQELRLVYAEIEFGTPRPAALAHMAERIPLETLRSIIGAVNQAESLGTPLSTILKNQSGMMRMHRSVRAEKLSASASLRILVPSMLILLAVILIVFGPMIMRYAAYGTDWAGWAGR